MQIEVSVEKIKATFEIAEKFLGNNNVETFMNYAYVEIGDKKGMITTSDGNHSFSSPFEIGEFKTEKEGDNKFLLPMKSFMGLLKGLPQNDFTIINEGTTIKVKGKKFKYSMPVRTTDFGFLTQGNIQNSLKINAKDLCTAFEKVLYAASKDNSRRNLKAIYIKMDKEQTDVVATDAHRLAYKAVDTKNFIQTDKLTDVLIPTTIVQNILPLLKVYDGECELKIYDNVIQFCLGNGMLVTSRKIDEAYPNYKLVATLDMNEFDVVVSRRDLMDSLSRLTQMSKSSIATFTYNKNQLVIQVKEADKGEGEETIEIVNKTNVNATVVYNAEFIINALSVIATDEAVLRLATDINKPLAIKEFNGDNKYVSIIMPVRMS